MAGRTPLTTAEKERIYQAKVEGHSIPAIATDLHCSPATVRKWWRLARDHGRTRLHQARRGRGATGVLSRFAPQVTARALNLKRDHRRWGPNRVLVDLRRDPSLFGLALPSRSALSALFKAECPELLAKRRCRQPPSPPPDRPTAVQECWQLDMQESIPLQDDRVATICSIRDPVGAAILASQAFDVTSGQRGRKLTWEEVRSVIRSAFTRWQTLPDLVQTDNEVCLAGSPHDPYPSRLTFWLIGLGVVHRFIRPATPTDQAQIERTHRTLDNFVGLPDERPDLATLQMRLDLEREQHNAWFPSRASDCASRPPLRAHPELLVPRRPYQPDWERELFEEQRVYDYLATIELERKVSRSGQIQLGGRSRSVGRAYVGQIVHLRCDEIAHQWVVTSSDGVKLARLAVEGISVSELTGLVDEPLTLAAPIQLTLPCFVA
jgi:transposase-like protein